MDAQMADFFKNWSKVIDENTLSRTLGYVGEDMKKHLVSPDPDKVFRAFTECPYDTLNIVFLGMDPYPQKGVATGILFGNKAETKPEDYSPSLKVLKSSLDKYYTDLPCGKFSPELTYLARQGILMINSALTVRVGETGSHSVLWRSFIGSLLKNISTDKPNVIFVLFGNQAQSFKSYISSTNIVECVHPAYCARQGTLLPDIFSEIDKMMMKQGKVPPYWL